MSTSLQQLDEEAEPQPSGAQSTRELDRALVRSFAWSAVNRTISQAFAWAATIVVARTLTPTDYGIVGMASTILGVVDILRTSGVGSAILANPDMPDDEIAQLNTVSVLFGIGAFLACCLLAYPASLFFRTPSVAAVIVVSSLPFLIGSTRVVPNAIMRRDLDFRRFAYLNSTGAFVTAAAALAFALLGFGYWSLVLNQVLSSIVTTLMSIRWNPTPYLRPRLSALGERMRLTRDIVGARLVWYAYQSSDFIIVGRVLGQAALGAYSFAWTVVNLPVQKVTTLFIGNAQIFFGKVRHDNAQLRRYLRIVTEPLALATFPASVGVALVAEDFVAVALGGKWSEAVVPLRILSLYATIRCVSPLLPLVLNVVRKSNVVLRNSVLSAVVLPVAFLIGSRWGIEGIAVSWAVAYPPLVALLFRATFRAIDMRPSEYFGALRPAIVGCAVLTAAVLTCRWLLPHDIPRAAKFALEVASGAVAYVGLLLTVYRERVQTYRRFIKDAR